MMGRTLRAFFAALLIVAWVGAAAGPAAARADESGDTSFLLCEGNEDAPLYVVLLLDKSGSMEKVASEKTRVAAVEQFTGTLQRTAEDTGRAVHMNTVLFDIGTEALGWQEIKTTDDVDSAVELVKEAWADDNLGHNTDQIAALSTAYDLLEQQDGCRVVVMLTDGVIDTEDPGKNPEDISRARAEACSDAVTDGDGTRASLRERAETLGTNEFILLLEPTQRGIADFEDRLSVTMTLFSAITGDRTPPEIPYPRSDVIAFDPAAPTDDGEAVPRGLMCEPKYAQTGLVLSARDASQLEAYFLKLGAELGNGEPGVNDCPQPIPDGTEPLPDGTLIDRIQVISFNDTTGMSLDDFEIRQPDGTVIAASKALRAVATSDVELQLEIDDAAELPAGWRLKTVDAAGDGAGYCVQVTPREHFTAAFDVDENPVKVAGDDTEVILSITFDPAISGYELSFDLNGEPYTTTGGEVTVLLDPEMAKAAVVIDNGSIRALETTLFPALDVDISSGIKIWDRSPGALPTAACDADTVTLATGEVPPDGTVEAPTGCTVNPGAETAGDGATGTVPQPAYMRIVPSGTATRPATFVDADGNEITGDWVAFTEPLEITARITDLPNETDTFADTYMIEVASGPELTPTMEIDESAAIAVAVDLKARSNSVLATLLTVVIALLAAFLSMLLLWIFNRLTAQLPKATDFFYYEADPPGNGIGVGTLDHDRLAAANGVRGTLSFGSVAVRLVHPPWWRPLADSVGVLDAPGPAAADPTGPREGTIPVGFSSLVIGHRPAGDGTVRYTVVVPKRGPRSGIEGVAAILNDRTRLERLNRRLPAVPEESDGTGGDESGGGSGGTRPTGGSGGSGGPGVPGGTAPDTPPTTTDHDGDNEGPRGPSLPKGSGPRLPG